MIKGNIIIEGYQAKFINHWCEPADDPKDLGFACFFLSTEASWKRNLLVTWNPGSTRRSHYWLIIALFHILIVGLYGYGCEKTVREQSVNRERFGLYRIYQLLLSTTGRSVEGRSKR